MATDENGTRCNGWQRVQWLPQMAMGAMGVRRMALPEGSDGTAEVHEWHCRSVINGTAGVPWMALLEGTGMAGMQMMVLLRCYYMEIAAAASGLCHCRRLRLRHWA